MKKVEENSIHFAPTEPILIADFSLVIKACWNVKNEAKRFDMSVKSSSHSQGELRLEMFVNLKRSYDMCSFDDVFRTLWTTWSDYDL